MATLLVVHGAEKGRRYSVDELAVRLGRDDECPVRVVDNEISRQHAEIRSVGGEFSIHDLGSSNGTFVNGRRISESRLASGDRIQLGQTVLVFGAGTTAPQADLAKKISLITRAAIEDSSAIVKSLSQAEGSNFLNQLARADAASLKTSVAHLQVLFATSQAASHIVEPRELLRRILELIFQSVKTQRGCVLLKDEGTGQLEAAAVQYAGGANPDEQIEVSSTIIDYVLSKGEGVRTSDAAADQRFSPGKSIVRLGIREAICVPMQGRHGTIGVIYLDNHTTLEEELLRPTQGSHFSDEHLKLLVAIGHQAALAIEDTRYYQALLQSERLAAVGQTIATLSHHIKNILQGIKGGGHLIEMGLADHDEENVRRGWRIVNKNQTKIYDLVMDMLTYSKDREPAVEPTNLNELVGEVVELMESHAEGLSVKLHCVTDDSLPTVSVDPEGIHRATLNLLSNALDATAEKEGGAVELRTEFDLRHSIARIRVRDNGVGIPADDVPQIFQLFASTKGARGTGIGLSVSDKIVREHGGRIHVESEPGVGTEFVIELPVHAEPATMA